MEAPLGGEGDEHEDGADRRHDPRRCELQRRPLVGLRHCPSGPAVHLFSTLLRVLPISFSDWLIGCLQSSSSFKERELGASAISLVSFYAVRRTRNATGRTWCHGDSRGEGDSSWAHCPRSEELSGGPREYETGGQQQLTGGEPSFKRWWIVLAMGKSHWV